MLGQYRRRPGRDRWPRPARGFTLVELLVAVAVMAIGASLAAPDMARLMARQRMRHLAEGMLGGLQYARAEAIRRNTSVSFTLDASRTGWAVSQLSPAASLQAQPGGGGAASGLSVTADTAAASVTFLPTGLLQPGPQMRRVTVASVMAATDARRIDIFGGGLMRMCEPAVTAANDPRRC